MNYEWELLLVQDVMMSSNHGRFLQINGSVNNSMFCSFSYWSLKPRFASRVSRGTWKTGTKNIIWELLPGSTGLKLGTLYILYLKLMGCLNHDLKKNNCMFSPYGIQILPFLIQFQLHNFKEKYIFLYFLVPFWCVKRH